MSSCIFSLVFSYGHSLQVTLECPLCKAGVPRTQTSRVASDALLCAERIFLSGRNPHEIIGPTADAESTSGRPPSTWPLRSLFTQQPARTSVAAGTTGVAEVPEDADSSAQGPSRHEDDRGSAMAGEQQMSGYNGRRRAHGRGDGRQRGQSAEDREQEESDEEEEEAVIVPQPATRAWMEGHVTHLVNAVPHASPRQHHDAGHAHMHALEARAPAAGADTLDDGMRTVWDLPQLQSQSRAATHDHTILSHAHLDLDVSRPESSLRAPSRAVRLYPLASLSPVPESTSRLAGRNTSLSRHWTDQDATEGDGAADRRDWRHSGVPTSRRGNRTSPHSSTESSSSSLPTEMHEYAV